MVLMVGDSSLNLWSLNLESELSAKLSILSILEIAPALLCHVLEQAHHELVLIEFNRLLIINFMHVGSLAKVNAVDLLALSPILAVQQDPLVFFRVFLGNGGHTFLFDLDLEAFGLVVHHEILDVVRVLFQLVLIIGVSFDITLCYLYIENGGHI